MSVFSYLFNSTKVSVKPEQVSVIELLKEDFRQNKNIHTSVISLLTNNDTSCFGGAIRDMISGKQSTDVDLLWKTGNTHEYDGNTFIDVFQSEITSKFESFGLTVSIEKTNIVSLGGKAGYFDSKNQNNTSDSDNDDDDDDDNECYENDDELLNNLLYPKVTPGHSEYTLTIEDSEENKYSTILDITFSKGIGEVKPSVEEDSLQTRLDNDKFIELLLSSDSPSVVLERLRESLIENCVSMIPYKDPTNLISNLEDGKVTVYNIEQVKRIIKLGKLVHKGYKIQNIDSNLKTKVKMLDNSIYRGQEELTNEQKMYFKALCEYRDPKTHMWVL